MYDLSKMIDYSVFITAHVRQKLKVVHKLTSVRDRQRWAGIYLSYELDTAEIPLIVEPTEVLIYAIALIEAINKNFDGFEQVNSDLVPFDPMLEFIRIKEDASFTESIVNIVNAYFNPTVFSPMTGKIVVSAVGVLEGYDNPLSPVLINEHKLVSFVPTITTSRVDY